MASPLRGGGVRSLVEELFLWLTLGLDRISGKRNIQREYVTLSLELIAPKFIKGQLANFLWFDRSKDPKPHFLFLSPLKFQFFCINVCEGGGRDKSNWYGGGQFRRKCPPPIIKMPKFRGKVTFPPFPSPFFPSFILNPSFFYYVGHLSRESWERGVALPLNTPVQMT